MRPPALVLALAVALPVFAIDEQRLRDEIKAIQEEMKHVDEQDTEAYRIAARYAALGEKASALEWLRKATDHGLPLDPSNDERFASLHGDAEYERIVARVQREHPPVVKAKTAFTIAEADLVPEGAAYDPKSKSFFFSSLRKQKVIRIDANGRASDFITSKRDGLEATLGMKVDARTNSLWVNSVKGERESELMHYDLATAKLLGRYKPPTSGAHLFNDLVITKRGEVILTDSVAGKVYRLAAGANAFTDFLPSYALAYPNGIALSNDERLLYVADALHGISVIDMPTVTAKALAHDASITLGGIDGLYWYKKQLVAVHNGVVTQVARYRLTKDGLGVESAEVLDYRDSAVKVPTTGTIANGRFYFMANTQLGRENETSGEKPFDPIVVLEVPLP